MGSAISAEIEVPLFVKTSVSSPLRIFDDGYCFYSLISFEKTK